MKQYYRDMVIRSWQPGDRQAVADLARTVLAEYDMVFDPEQSDRDAVQVETAYWDTGGAFWVVDYQGQIVGSGGYHPCDRRLPPISVAASPNSLFPNSPFPNSPSDMPPNNPIQRGVELRKMFLRSDIRGRGLGRYLLQALEQSACNQGFTHMWLETAGHMQAAIKLYERNGYQQPPNTGVHVQRCDRVYVKPL